MHEEWHTGKATTSTSILSGALYSPHMVQHVPTRTRRYFDNAATSFPKPPETSRNLPEPSGISKEQPSGAAKSSQE